MKVLFVFAHPDDLETSVGGLAWKLARAGHELRIIVATSARKDKVHNGRPLMRVREEEGTKAFEMLGAHRWIFLQNEYPDLFETGFLEVHAWSKWFFTNLLKDYPADVVITFWGNDVHGDHRAISSLTQHVFLQRGNNTEFLCCEVRAGTTVPEPQTLNFFPTHYVDISGKLFGCKRELLFYHKSQNPRGLWESNMGLWAKRGAECGVQYAEAYSRMTREGTLYPELEQFFIPALTE